MRLLFTRAANTVLNLVVGFGFPSELTQRLAPPHPPARVEREPAPASVAPQTERGRPAGSTDCGFVAYLRRTESAEVDA